MPVNINLDFVADATGTVDVITATYTPAPPSLYDGLLLFFFASGANTSTTPSFSPNGLTARTIVKRGGTALVAGDIPAANALVGLAYDLGNTRWEMLNTGGGDSFWEAGSAADSLKDKRSAASSDSDGTAIGTSADNSGQGGFSIGFAADNDGHFGQAIGTGAQNTQDNSQAIGESSINSGALGQALGQGSQNRIDSSTNISGAIIIRKDNAEGYTAAQKYQYYAGTDDVILSEEVSLKALATTTVTLPSGVHIYVNEVGVEITSANIVTGQPTISYGNTGNNSSILAPTATTGLTAAFKDDKSIVASDGLTSLTAEVTIAATGTTLLGRFYWKGKIVEDE